MQSKLSRRVIARTIAAKLLDEPAQRSHWVRVLAAYLVEHNRTEETDLIVNDIARELFIQSGHLSVTVTSARPLARAVREELAATLKSATGAKHVEVAEHTQSSLLGGLVARTPDAVLDISVRHQLQQLAAIK